MAWDNMLAKTKICPICGKEFEILSYQFKNWAWRIGSDAHNPRYVCSYSCLRKWEKEKKSRKNQSL